MAGGRPNKYHTHVEPKLLLIAAWCRNGLTDAQICKNLDVSHESFIQYKKEFPELVETLKQNKEVIDTMVENALLKAAMGYEYDEVSYDKDGNEIFRNTKTAHPNTTAMIFWLKNRNQKAWKDKHDVEHSGQVTNKIDLSGLSVEELKAYAKAKQRAT